MLRKILIKIIQSNEYRFLGVFNSMKFSKVYNIISNPLEFRKKSTLMKYFDDLGSKTKKDLIQNGYSFANFCGHKDHIKLLQNYVKNIDLKFTNKKFMTNVLDTKKPSELLDKLIQFSLNPVILDPVIQYFGFVPKLTSIKLLVSIPNKGNLTSSQLLHLDTADLPGNHCKVFINLEKTNISNGAFSFLDSNSSSQLINKTNYGKRGVDYRIKDEKLAQILSPNKIIRCEGDEYSGLFIDTSRCFHMGSRVIEGDRKILMLQFTSPNQSRLNKPHKLALTNKNILEKFSILQRFVIN